MDNRFIPWTIGFGIATFAGFALCLGVGNTFKNALLIYNKNEKISSTEAGERLLEIRQYKELYAELLVEKEEEEAEDYADEEVDA